MSRIFIFLRTFTDINLCFLETIFTKLVVGASIMKKMLREMIFQETIHPCERLSKDWVKLSLKIDEINA